MQPAVQADQPNASVTTSLNYLIDTGEKPVTYSNAPGGPRRVRDLLPSDEAAERLQHRFAVVQVWRPINKPVQSSPLAIADARSLSNEDLIATERRYPDRVGEIYHITFNPDHRWVYFPNMERNEALVFKTYDCGKDGRARRTAHAAFDDPMSPPDAPARESIEARTLAFFAPAKKSVIS